MVLADRLLERIDELQSPCVVGLDPVVERLPAGLLTRGGFEGVVEAFTKFNCEIIDAIADLVPAVKPQIAFYEQYGPQGVRAYEVTVDYACAKGLIVIGDTKRNDIGSTAKAYADGHLGVVKTRLTVQTSINVDMLTVNPYLGTDGLDPFVEVCRGHDKGLFILTKTSNPSSGQLQDRLVEMTDEEEEVLRSLGVLTGRGKNTEFYNLVALLVRRYAEDQVGDRGYSSIGAVVGATYPKQAEVLRKIMPHSIFLVPGYGAQGAKADNLTNCFNDDGFGALVNSSRKVIFAYENDTDSRDFAACSRRETVRMIDDIKGALGRAGKLPSGWG